MKVVKTTIPAQSLFSNRKFDYFDAYRTDVPDTNGGIDVIVAARAMFSSMAGWIGRLMKLRNRIVSVIGLKTGKTKEDPEAVLRNFKGNPGEKIGIFKVFEKEEYELVMGEDDRHLNFRVSLFLSSREDHIKELTLATIVDYNNWFGRLYFFFVKPFHKLIVRSMMRRMLAGLK